MPLQLLLYYLHITHDACNISKTRSLHRSVINNWEVLNIELENISSKNSILYEKWFDFVYDV